MATQRYVSTSFWDDEWVQGLSSDEKYLYLYLLTNPLTNIAGVYEITDRRITFDTGLSGTLVAKILGRFMEDGKAVRHKGWIILPAWPEHQRWSTAPKIKAGIEIILRTLSPEILNRMVQVGYRYPIDTLSIPYVYPSNYIDSDSDSDLSPQPPVRVQKKEEPKKTKTEPEIPEAFRVEWEEYAQMRKEKRCKLTPTTVAKLLKKLSKYPPEVARGMLAKSVEKGWTGVFGPDDGSSEKGAGVPRTAMSDDKWNVHNIKGDAR